MSPIIRPIMRNDEPGKENGAEQLTPHDAVTSEGCPSWDRTRTLLIQSQETASASTVVNPLTAPLSTSGASGDPIGEGLEGGSTTHSHHESHQVADSLVARATTRTARSSDEAWMDIAVDLAANRDDSARLDWLQRVLCDARDGELTAYGTMDGGVTLAIGILGLAGYRSAHRSTLRDAIDALTAPAGLPAEGNQTERTPNA